MATIVYSIGAVGTPGPQGSPGPEGNPGAQGLQGATGPQGTVGAQGTTGSAGAQGANGTQGIQGTTGTTALPLATSVTYTPLYKTWATPTSNVNSTLNIILLSNHGLVNGDAVIYYTGGGSPIAPLTNASTYYIRVYDANNVYLYDTAAHAINTASTTGLKDLGATGTNSQYFTTQGAGASTEVTFDGSSYQVFIVNTSTVGGIIANLTANLTDGQTQEYKFIIPGGSTNYSFTSNKVNSNSITGVVSTINASVTNTIEILLVKLNGSYTIYSK